MIDNLDWEALLADCTDFARRLIQQPSMTGQERALAHLVAEEMRRLNYDEVWLDSAGNVSGRIYGKDRSLGAIVLNSHLDHVDPGDLSLWPYPPYSAEVVDDRIHGRGACDIKGPLAVQVYSIAALRRVDQRPLRDVVFCGVVEEEVGGAGAVYWAKNLDYDVDLIVLGEPSSNQLSLGHRGILQMWVKFTGRSVHASVPVEAINPNLFLAEFLLRLERRKGGLPNHALLGGTTVASTIIEVDTASMNVTPAWSRVLLDFRTAAMSVAEITDFVSAVAHDLPFKISDAWSSEPDAPLPHSDETIYGFYTEPDSEEVARVRSALGEGLERLPELSSYQFATDGRHFRALGVTIVGFSPGEEQLAHTVDESISIKMMADSLRGYCRLLCSY